MGVAYGVEMEGKSFKAEKRPAARAVGELLSDLILSRSAALKSECS